VDKLASRSRIFLTAGGLGLFVWFVYLMLLITLQYVPAATDVAFLRIKPEEVALWYYPGVFFGHVYTSIFVLVLGGPQFVAVLRLRWPGVHRQTGKVYILLILLVAAPTGLVMGWHANGGPWSQLSFCLQAVLWWWFTWRAWRLALRQDWDSHRAFMLRSFALTLSAVSLRAWKWLIVMTLAPGPMDTYRVVAWLGWMGNLVVVEWWIRKCSPQ